MGAERTSQPLEIASAVCLETLRRILLNMDTFARVSVRRVGLCVVPRRGLPINPLLAGDVAALVKINEDEAVLVRTLIGPAFALLFRGVANEPDHKRPGRDILANLREILVRQLVGTTGLKKCQADQG